MVTLVEAPKIQIPKRLKEESLFHFLDDDNCERLQHDIRSQEFPFGSVYTETLGQDLDGKLNEDAPLILPMGDERVLFAVLDGASSQNEITGLAPYGISGAFYISHLVAFGFGNSEEYKKLTSMPDLTAKEIMETVNSWVFDQMQKVGGVDYSDISSIPGMAAVFLLVDPKKGVASIAQVADSMAISYSKTKGIKVLTPNLNDKFDRETMTYAKAVAKELGCSLAQVRKTPEGKERIRKQLQDSFRKKTNREGGCGVLNGMPQLFENRLVFSGEIPLTPDLSSICLISDGTLLPYARSGLSREESARQLVNNLYTNDAESVLERGVAILDQDPNFDKIPRLKKRDDSTIIVIKFK